MRVCFQRGASAEGEEDDDGEPLLLHAALNGEVNLVRELLIGGACPNVRSKSDSTALHAAAESASVETLELLALWGCDVNALDAKGLSPMIIACYDGSTDCVRSLALLPSASFS